MEWTVVSPGIWVIANYEGYRVTKMQQGEKQTRKIDARGHWIMEPEYLFIACLIEPPYTRLDGKTWEAVRSKIHAGMAATLF